MPFLADMDPGQFAGYALYSIWHILLIIKELQNPPKFAVLLNFEVQTWIPRPNCAESEEFLQISINQVAAILTSASRATGI